VRCDTTEQGHSLFHEFATNAKVFSSGNDFQHHICASNNQAIVNHGYLINSYCFHTSEVTSSFWKQLSGGNNGVVRPGRCGAQSAVLGPEGREMKVSKKY
jgi:hypothetical protein